MYQIEGPNAFSDYTNRHPIFDYTVFDNIRYIYECGGNIIKDLAINDTNDMDESSLQYNMALRDSLMQYDFRNKPGGMMFLLRTDTICISHHIKLDLDYIRYEYKKRY